MQHNQLLVRSQIGVVANLLKDFALNLIEIEIRHPKELYYQQFDLIWMSFFQLFVGILYHSFSCWLVVVFIRHDLSF